MVRLARPRATRDPASGSGLRQLTLGSWIEQRVTRGGTAAAAHHAARVLTVVLAMMGVGILLRVSHAATILGPEEFRGYLVSDLAVRGLGLLVLLAAARLGPAGLRRAIPLLALVSLGLLLAVWLPGIGAPANGAHRWIRVGLSIQPSDLARVALVLWVADRCVRLGPLSGDFFRGVAPMLAFVLLFAGLVALQPDLGGAILLTVSALATMWIGGVALSRVGPVLLIVAASAVSIMAALLPYVRARLDMFLGVRDNEQVGDSVRALAHAGPFGQGLTGGELRNRGFNYMDSDFAFALLGEEWGLVGLFLLLGLWVAFLWCSLRMVLALSDRFEAVAAFGLCMVLVFQALVHIQVAAGMAPPKGMTLPFLSAGGTSFVVSSLAVGLAIGAARREALLSSRCSPSNATA